MTKLNIKLTLPRRDGARVTLHVQRAKAELTAQGTEVEVWIWKTAVEPVQPRTTVEPEGWRAEV